MNNDTRLNFMRFLSYSQELAKTTCKDYTSEFVLEYIEVCEELKYQLQNDETII